MLANASKMDILADGYPASSLDELCAYIVVSYIFTSWLCYSEGLGSYCPNVYLQLRCANKTINYHGTFVRGGHPCEFLRPYGRPLDSFSSLWAAFTMTVHINTLYNESVHEWKNIQLELIRFH